jgi:hypothetical protein
VVQKLNLKFFNQEQTEKTLKICIKDSIESTEELLKRGVSPGFSIKYESFRFYLGN